MTVTTLTTTVLHLENALVCAVPLHLERLAGNRLFSGNSKCRLPSPQISTSPIILLYQDGGLTLFGTKSSGDETARYKYAGTWNFLSLPAFVT
ncbi:hypothetical protein BC938DRAFT_471831 [Jimgerdemannia flammicorona]|uniref:Uncharacterized protein n=1 Tax=Jimgerdemannia flammicorona TaxID=994334 RepID=A0A433QUJ8_9FUNG|nr:hypothetical protein BC938DRAFT_471831 [Jimgerdemannia flammicorona]